MRVIATAGHVDHGKSTLVRALTGVDPDRLGEEKRRGLTIELGFAGLTLPSGERLAFVDVPGHRRFIGTMLAGLGPAPLVLFVVAADQGWQAQSREHLDAIDALGLTRGLLVLTRCGLADAERIAEVRDTALAEIARTSLGRLDVVETDARAGSGLDDLVSALDDLVAGLPLVDVDAPVRFWIDRSFSIKGAGTVVTGTLAQGRLRIGDRLTHGGRSVVVRSLEVLGEAVEEALPVARVALGLRGVSADDVPRGTVLMAQADAPVATVVDVRRMSGHPWRDAAEQLTVHLGTSAVAARCRPLDDETARLTLDHPVPLRLGDRLIVRDPSASRIHCGALVLDLDPLPLRRRGAAAQRAATLGTWVVGRAEDLVTDRGVVSQAWLDAVGARWAQEPSRGLDLERIGVAEGFAVSGEQVAVWLGAVTALVTEDARDALSRGVTTGSITSTCGVPVQLVDGVVAAAGLASVDGRVVGAEHGQTLGSAQAGLDRLRERLQSAPFDAPEAEELEELGLGSREVAAAAERGLVLRLVARPADIVLLPDAPARAMRALAGLPQPFTTSEARQALGTTRRVVIPLLEHLDGRGWTRREGNSRVVVR